MWASSSVQFVHPLPLGAKIERYSSILSIKEKAGSSGRLKFMELEHRTLAEGKEAVREVQTVVYRQASREAILRPSVREELDVSAWTWHRRITPDEVLLFRYSALSFNAHRIHYDRAYATRSEGYPDLVVHAPLMATLLIDLCRRHIGEQPLSTFKFRGMSPAFAGDPLHLVGRREGENITLAVLGGDGRAVVDASARIRVV
jgi:3-methylfumaryl-CoA hydratase